MTESVKTATNQTDGALNRSGDQELSGQRLFWKFAFQRDTVFCAMKVASVITPILTVFNHFQEIVDLRMGLTFWIQVALTFCVPFCVSTYSSAMAGMREYRRQQATA